MGERLNRGKGRGMEDRGQRSEADATVFRCLGVSTQAKRANEFQGGAVVRCAASLLSRCRLKGGTPNLGWRR